MDLRTANDSKGNPGPQLASSTHVTFEIARGAIFECIEVLYSQPLPLRVDDDCVNAHLPTGPIPD